MMKHGESSAKTALITGATVGIGYQLSRLFAKDNYNLVLVARNEEKLKERKNELENQYGVSIAVIAKDLAKPDAPQEIYTDLRKESIDIDVLVNNAGFGATGIFAEVDLQRQLDMIQLHITTLTALTKLFLKDMLRRGQGKIMNVASTAAFQPGPTMSVYYATKAYVLSFTEALANELKGSGITVSVVCPGPTQTEFQVRAGFKNTLLMKSHVMSAEAVARIAYKKFYNGKTLIITGFLNRLLVHFVRFSPRKLVIALVRFLQENR